MTLFSILILSHNKEGVGISMRKDITIEKIMLGGERLNKSALARQYGCCWETIDRRLNPDKYKKERILSPLWYHISVISKSIDQD